VNEDEGTGNTAIYNKKIGYSAVTAGDCFQTILMGNSV
jgi:hypothetical protein